MQIEKGIKPGPAKVVIYGPEGIGKTTFASKFPKPLFLDLDDGSRRLDVDRVTGLDSFALVRATLTELSRDAQGYRTIVIDTADKLEAMIIQGVIDEVPRGDGKSVSGIEDYGYGKGYTYVKERLAKFLDTLSAMQARTGLNIVFLCHAWQRKVEQPGETQSYDHYEMKLSKQAAPLLREWPDFLLFLNYDITVVKTADGKNVANGGQRCIYTCHTPYYDAKSRAEMPERLRLDDKGVAQVFAAMFGSERKPEPPKPQPEPEPKPEPKPEPPQPKNIVKTEEFDPQSPAEQEKSRLLSDLDALLKAEGLTYDDLELATSHPKVNMRPKGTPIGAFSVQDLKRLTSGFEAVKKTIIKVKGA
jgi:hypothetical protein